MIKNLVISGGGFKTIPIIGALKMLRDKGVLQNITSFHATSAGAIYSLLLILDYAIEDIEKIIFDFDINKIFKPIIDVENFFINYNVYDRNIFTKLIKLLINYKLKKDGIDYSNITLYQFFLKTKKKLTCATISMKTRTVKYFNYINQPNLPLYKLIMMTSCIPLVFNPVSWRNDKYIDGGLIDNFPLYNIPAIDIDKTIGIYAKIKLKHIVPEFENIYDYMQCILSICTLSTKTIPIFNVIHVSMHEKYSGNIINIKLSRKEKDNIINKSYNDALKQYISFQHKKLKVTEKKIVRRNSF
jgi:predicted acylesterase/phospholipase RssA